MLMVRLIALALAVAVTATGCAGIQAAAELGPEEKGAACITVVAASINPMVNGETRAAILEINTGDPDAVISPEMIAQVAEAMGCP
tara:strand:- start:22870 stop:23127 length:258 start_codon:yes stop_codon:yes gene_type:complete